MSVTGNIHDSWNEYYGFGSSNSVDDYGYYKNNDYGTVQLNNTTGAASKTLDGTFDETTNHTIYYHEFYKRKQHTTNQHFQGSRLSFVVKGFTYPTDVTATQNKWNKTVTLQWNVNNNKKNANYDQDGEWIVFRKKEGDSKYSILTRFKNNGQELFVQLLAQFRACGLSKTGAATLAAIAIEGELADYQHFAVYGVQT